MSRIASLSVGCAGFALVLTLALRTTGAGFVSAACPVQNAAGQSAPGDVLRSARTVFIRSNSVYFKASALENALLNRPEFQQWGMAVTRDDADADLVIEVGRKVFTTRFIYSVIDPRTNRIVAGGKISSLGGTVEGKISDSFVKKLRAVRPLPASARGK